MYDLQIFSPFCGLSLHFLDSVFSSSTKVFNFNEVWFIYFCPFLVANIFDIISETPLADQCFWVLSILQHASPLHFLKLLNNNIIVLLTHSLFTCLSVDGHLGCFHLLAILNNATMKIHVEAFLWAYIFIFLGYITRNGISGLCGNSVLPCDELTGSFPNQLHYFTFLPAV